MKNLKKSGELTFDNFRQLANNKALKRNEKIDFPESYRSGYSDVILRDIEHKLHLTDRTGSVICDIGCGCGDLVIATTSWARKHRHTLILIDSKEMLAQIPVSKAIKFPGEFPQVPLLFRKYTHACDKVICYSVLQYIFNQKDIFNFISRALDLLTTGGMLLLGDIPNEDKRNRFLKTPEGASFTGVPRDISQKIDDSVIMAILLRFRRLGYETYLTPQSDRLPMANRREDIVMIKRI